MAHAGLSHALFTSNPYLLGLSTSDRAGCAVRCAAELFLNALESNATEVRVEVRAAGGGVVEVEVTGAGGREREKRGGEHSRRRRKRKGAVNAVFAPARRSQKARARRTARECFMLVSV